MFVRLALEEERDKVVELCRLAVEESVRGIAPELPAIEQTFQSYLDGADPTFFVVDQAGEPIAFLMCSISGYPFATGIYTTQEVLFVRPDKRGTRAAALLVRELIAWSTQLGAREITGGNDNGLFSETTARLLEKHGFERVGIFMRRPGVQ